MSDGGTPRHKPPDASDAPRYTGIRTFARCPHTRELEEADVAAVGIPFDTGTSFRPGARFGPEAIRAASVLLRDHHPAQGVNVFSTLSVIDWGDVQVAPTDIQRSLELIAEGVGEVTAGGVAPLCLGGDHLVALAELRALAERHGPLALVLLDSHADTWDSYFGERYFHGTPFRRAAEEGLVAPERSILAGMRGPLYAASDLDETRGLGFEVVQWDELRRMAADEYGARVRERVGEGPAYLSFDIDFVDPAFAPATGTPEVGGPTSAQALDYVRALTAIDFRGFDVVEVSPPYDTAGQTTALLAANVAYEFLALTALARRPPEPGP
jgi:agmatinase